MTAEQKIWFDTLTDALRLGIDIEGAIDRADLILKAYRETFPTVTSGDNYKPVSSTADNAKKAMRMAEESPWGTLDND